MPILLQIWTQLWKIEYPINIGNKILLSYLIEAIAQLSYGYNT